MIAASSNGRCVDRAVSTMRAALGYKTPLPEEWDDDVDNRYNTQVITLFHHAFPDRNVLVWCKKEYWDKSGQLLNWMGDEIVSSPEWDNYLFAFAYVVDDEKELSHMVLGWPRGHPDMAVGIALAVRI